eukprot:jgi/Tetstr1/439278/TSEL_027720.t1
MRRFQRKTHRNSTAEFFAGTALSVEDAARYDVTHTVGRGHQSEGVAAAVDLKTGKQVAIKKFKAIQTRHKAQQVLNEIIIHQRLTAQGGNVIQLLDVLTPDDPNRSDWVLIVMEMAETDVGRELRTLSRSSSLRMKKVLVFQILAGLRDMHNAGFIHGDLFGKNVFVRGDCTLGLDVWNVGRALLAMTLGKDMVYHANWTEARGVQTWLLEYGPPPPELAEYFTQDAQAAMQDPTAAALAMEELFPGVEPEVMQFCKRLMNWDLLRLPSAADFMHDPFFDDVRSELLLAQANRGPTHNTAAASPVSHVGLPQLPRSSDWKQPFVEALHEAARGLFRQVAQE